MLLNKILDSKNKLKILRELCLHENWEYNINELSKHAKVHRVRVSNIIKELEQKKVIKARYKGRTKLIRINKEDFFVRSLLVDLFKKEKNLPKEIIKDMITNLKISKEIISIVLYGSAIEDTFTFKSDIDLMFIYKKKIVSKEKIEEAINKYEKKGLLISSDFIILKEFKKLYQNKEPSIISLVKNHIVIYGKNLLEVI